MAALSYTLTLSLFFSLLCNVTRIHAYTLLANPRTKVAAVAIARQQASPTFPADPPSCPKCAPSYPSINSCAAAAPVFENASTIIFNPGAFIDVIKCACTDTFQAAYPQCVDCFIRTNQTEFLSTSADEVPDILSGIRSICALESTLLGNVSAVDGEVPSSATDSAASPTGSISSAEKLYAGTRIVMQMALVTTGLGLIACLI